MRAPLSVRFLTNHDSVRAGQKQVLTEMVKYGYINEETMNLIMSHKEEYRELFNKR